MTLNLDDDFLNVADNLEPVTLRTPGTTATLDVPEALRRRVSVSEAAAAGGKYSASDVAWHLPAGVVTVQPALGSTITDSAGSTWTVLEVHLETLGSRWRCVARDLAIAGRLDTVITIEKAAVTKSAGGAAEYAWDVYRAGLRARIQPRAAERTVDNDLRTGKTPFAIYVAEQVLVDQTHRVVASDGTVYQVTGYEAADRIDGLFVIHAVLSAWPLG